MSNSFKYIDIHGHVNLPEFDHDRDEVIERARRSGVIMVTVGTDVEMSKKAVELATKHDHFWAIVGIHPTETKIDSDQLESDFKVLGELAKHPKVIAIGECGLDYFHSKPDEISAQKELFKRHIALAEMVNKPLMLHVRNGKLMGSKSDIGNAYQDTLLMLKDHQKIKANFHFFAGAKEDLKNITEAGYTVSYTGVITFTRDYDELIRSTPISQIMSETDCPFVPPVPYRGKRNEPAFVIETVKKIAEIRGEDEATITERILGNAKKFFGF